MRPATRRRWTKRGAILAAFAVWIVAPVSCWAIAPGQVDDFNNTTSTLNWGIGTDGLIPADNAPNEGKTFAVGDNALLVDTDELGVTRLLVNNTVQWTGNWTAAGLQQIAMDARNPNPFPLFLRLGIAGPGGVAFMGGGDTYVTGPIVVPADNTWYSIVFDVLAPAFTALGGSNIDAALADVKHVRILNNTSASFVGAMLGGAVYLDNIRAVAIPEPGTLLLAAMGFSILAVWRWNDRSAAAKCRAPR